jgi:hypothetical protein
VRTNLEAGNFRLMECPLDRTGQDAWRDVIPAREEVLLEDFEVFTDWLVVAERYDGLTHVRVIPTGGGPDHTLAFADPTWAVGTEANPEMDTDVLRYMYTSPTTPPTVYAFDMRSHTQELLKRQEVLGGFDPADYTAEYLRVHLPATAPWCPFHSCGGRTRRSTARRRCCSTATARTATARARDSMRARSPCSTAASSTPSPMCGAVRRWGAAGTRTASC